MQRLRQNHHLVGKPAPREIHATALWDADELDGLRCSLAASRRIQQFFPDWFATHLSKRPCTYEQLWRNVGVWVRLAERHLLPVEMPDAWWHTPHDPISAVDMDAATASLCEISMCRHMIDQPQTMMYGIGTQELLDETDNRSPGLLTVGVWWLLDLTAWPLGIDWPQLLEHCKLSPQQAELLQGLPQLPSNTPVEDLRQTLPHGPRAWGVPRASPSHMILDICLSMGGSPYGLVIQRPCCFVQGV